MKYLVSMTKDGGHYNNCALYMILKYYDIYEI